MPKKRRKSLVGHNASWIFVPLAQAPGNAQIDFGGAFVVIAEVEQEAHFQCGDLTHSPFQNQMVLEWSEQRTQIQSILPSSRSNCWAFWNDLLDQ